MMYFHVYRTISTPRHFSKIASQLFFKYDFVRRFRMVPKNSTFTSHDIESDRTSSQLSVDIFMTSKDQKQPQKSLAEQKILQKGVNPWHPPTLG